MTDRQWTGVVLAGGKSTRMGHDKALIEVDGMTMLERSIELLRPHVREILVIADPAKYSSPHARVIPDDLPEKGPLGGLVTALRCSRYVRLLVVACDLPSINDRLLVRLKKELIGEINAAVPQHGEMIEPLAAAYHKRCIEPFEERVKSDVLKMSRALAVVRTAFVPIEPGADGWPVDLFRNVNTPADL